MMTVDPCELTRETFEKIELDRRYNCPEDAVWDAFELGKKAGCAGVCGPDMTIEEAAMEMREILQGLHRLSCGE